MTKKWSHEDQPWVSNYPPLRDWLNKVGARCHGQLPVGNPAKPRAFIETWLAGQGVFIVEVRAEKMGWDLFTSLGANDIPLTLADAEERLRIGVSK